MMSLTKKKGDFRCFSRIRIKRSGCLILGFLANAELFLRTAYGYLSKSRSLTYKLTMKSKLSPKHAVIAYD